MGSFVFCRTWCIWTQCNCVTVVQSRVLNVVHFQGFCLNDLNTHSWIIFLWGGVNSDANLRKILNWGTLIPRLFFLGPDCLTNCRERSASESSSSLDNQICAIYGTCRCITVFTRTRYLSMSWAIVIQSTSFQPISLLTPDHSNYRIFQ